MCGIAGIINLYNNHPVQKQLITDMTNTMHHRGPDDYGIFVDEKVALGHRRLSIIDLSPIGKQPMWDINERVGIVFNGEIYNFNEIKEELLQKGYQFKSHTDTEVIINAYLEYGIKCLEKFNGMFGLCIYDKYNNKSYIARDRIGIKPLYYTETDGKLVFSSEIKAILKYPGFTPSPNKTAISSYLGYRYPIGEYSFFEDINALMPGHYLEIVGDKIAVHQYWDLPIYKEKDDLGEQYYIDKIRELMQSSINYRMISDVPLGAYLSGGLDSSIVVALMSKNTSEKIKTFTIGFEEEGYNEFDYSQLVADRYKTDHHKILLSNEDYFENMVKLIKYKDAPLGVANEPALHVMSKELKKFITVVLSGEGADEIFGGYGRIFRSPFDYERICGLQNNGSLSDLDVSKILQTNLNNRYGDKKFKSEVEHFLYNYQYIKWDDKTNYLDPGMIDFLDNDKTLNNIFQRNFDKIDGLNLYDKYMWIFEKLHIVGLLQRVDTTTMATSVEARVPFIDHRLVEFALSIPHKYKLKWKSDMHKIVASVLTGDKISEVYDQPKHILKKSFERDLPHDVVWRKKMGFPVPVHKWFGDNFNDFAKDLLLSSNAKTRGIYNTKFIETALNSKSSFENHSFGLQIWMLVNLELWFNEYFS